jgi:hypothetical protein
VETTDHGVKDEAVGFGISEVRLNIDIVVVDDDDDDKKKKKKKIM